MYIVVIAWMYVILMVSLFQSSLFRGLVTFVGAGVLPLALILYIFGTPQRRRQQQSQEPTVPTETVSPRDPD
jgi:membrane protein implicated in regulation of membrane protease activity